MNRIEDIVRRSCRPSGRRAPRGIVVLTGLLLLVGLAVRTAPAQPSADPWQLYIEAASQAPSQKSVATLLKAALDVAQRNDPDGPRPALTRMLLQAAYVGLDRMDLARSIGAIRIEFARLDASHRPALATLAWMANEHYAAWTRLPDAPETEEMHAKKVVALAIAVRLRRVELAIRRKLGEQDPAELARALARYAELCEKQGNLEEAQNSLEEADRIWNGIASKRDKLVAASQHASLFPPARGQTPVSWSGDSSSGDDPISVKLTLARYHLWRGQDYQKNGTREDAVRAFIAAEAKLREALDLFEKDWPNHKTTGRLYFALAGTYVNWEGRGEYAETAYRRALAIYEAIRGPASAEVAIIVKYFAAALHRAGKPDEARELEARYRTGHKRGG